MQGRGVSCAKFCIFAVILLPVVGSAFINILLGGAIRLRLYPLNLMRLVPPEGKRGRRPTSLVY